MEKLAEGREKLKDDGQNVSLWLSALASFCGHLAKKYAGIELSALLQYLVNTLKDNQSLDLLVLKELITRMTGSEALEDVSESQAQAMAGADVLRSEAINFNNVTRARARQGYREAARRASARRARGDPLTVPLLVLNAQCRQAIIFKTDSNHLKLVSQLYDSCQRPSSTTAISSRRRSTWTSTPPCSRRSRRSCTSTASNPALRSTNAAFAATQTRTRPPDDPSKDRDAAVALDVGGRKGDVGRTPARRQRDAPGRGVATPSRPSCTSAALVAVAVRFACPPREIRRRPGADAHD